MEYVDGKNALEWIKGSEGAPADLVGRADRPSPALGAANTPIPRVTSTATSSRPTCWSWARSTGPRVKLTDFGLAKSFAETEGFTTLTRQGDIGGSIGFISPDHIREFSEVREPADIYCAAATLFYLLTNRYPYLGFDPRKPGSYEIILSTPPFRCALSGPTPPKAWNASC